MAAALKVLSTTELLEDILLGLPQKDILLDQRVSKGWKATIAGSVKLQRVLFFRAIGDAVDYPCSAFTGNTLLEIVHKWIWLAYKPHPLRRFMYIPMDRPRNDSVFRKEASWRRMFPSQPPVKNLTITGKIGSQVVATKLASKSGITLDHFFETCRVLFRTWDSIDVKAAVGMMKRFSCYAQIEELRKRREMLKKIKVKAHNESI